MRLPIQWLNQTGIRKKNLALSTSQRTHILWFFLTRDSGHLKNGILMRKVKKLNHRKMFNILLTHILTYLILYNPTTYFLRNSKLIYWTYKRYESGYLFCLIIHNIQLSKRRVYQTTRWNLDGGLMKKKLSNSIWNILHLVTH